MNVRNGPSLDAEIIGVLPAGTAVEVMEVANDWMKVRHNNGTAHILYAGGKFADIRN